MAILMPLEIKCHTVPQLKGLNSSLEPSTRRGRCNTFTIDHKSLKSAHFPSKTGQTMVSYERSFIYLSVDCSDWNRFNNISLINDSVKWIFQNYLAKITSLLPIWTDGKISLFFDWVGYELYRVFFGAERFLLYRLSFSCEKTLNIKELKK